MSKESKHSIDNRIIFKENFQSEQWTRRLGGVPIDVDYSNGIGTFDGAETTKILYPSSIADTYSVRIKGKITNTSSPNYLIDFRSETPLGAGRIYSSENTFFRAPDGTIYVDGIIGNTFVTNQMFEIVVTGINIDAKQIKIGNQAAASNNLIGDIELVEIYKGTLTAEEVSNLYENKTFHELPDVINEDTYKILDVAAFGGVLEDKMGNTLIPTDIEIKKIGSNVWSPDLNALTSKIDAGNFDDLTGDKTFLFNIKALSEGELSQGRIIDNGKLFLYITTTGQIRFSSEGITVVSSASGVITFNKNQCCSIIRKSNGQATIRVDGIISGPVDQNSGIPVGGTTNLFIGNKSTGTTAYDGQIPRVVIYIGLLSSEQEVQYCTNTKRYYE